MVNAQHAQNLQNVKALENARYMELFSQNAEMVARKTEASRMELAHRGMSNSGVAGKQFVDIRVEGFEEFLGRVIELRREMITLAPELGSQYELDQLKSKLNHHADALPNSIRTFISQQPRGGGKIEITGQLPIMATTLKAKIAQKIDIVLKENRVQRKPSGTIHIAAGPGAIVNFGDVTNSIQSTLNKIGGAGELTKALKELVEAIQASDELSDHKKAEVLESVEFVANQAAVDPAQRQKPNIIQTVWNGLGTTLANAANLAKIYDVAGHALSAYLAGHPHV